MRHTEGRGGAGRTSVSQAGRWGRENPVFTPLRAVTLGEIVHCFISFILCHFLFLDVCLIPKKPNGSDHTRKVPLMAFNTRLSTHAFWGAILSLLSKTLGGKWGS